MTSNPEDLRRFACPRSTETPAILSLEADGSLVALDGPGDRLEVSEERDREREDVEADAL
jgi:hypothetical protein